MWNHGYQGGKASHGDSIPLWWVRREARRGHTKVRKCKTSAWRRKNRKKEKEKKEGRGKKWAGSVHQAAHVPLACIYITIQRHPSLTHSPELLFHLRPCLHPYSCFPLWVSVFSRCAATTRNLSNSFHFHHCPAPSDQPPTPSHSRLSDWQVRMEEIKRAAAESSRRRQNQVG